MRDPLVPPPFEIAVDCNGERHWVEVIDGVPHARAHSTDDRVLEALGGRLPPCLRCADAVNRAPNHLHAYERLRQQVGDAQLAAIWRTSGRYVSGQFHEPEVDVTELPKTFVLLGMLSVERAMRGDFLDGAVRARAAGHPLKDEMERALVKRYVGTALSRDGLEGARLDLGEPGVDPAAPRTRVVIRASRDWLSTVLVFGLDDIGGRVTLGADLRVDGTAEIVQLERKRDRWVSRTIQVPLSDAFRLLPAGARA